MIELANQLFQGKEKFERIHTSGVKGRELTGALKDARRDESSEPPIMALPDRSEPR